MLTGKASCLCWTNKLPEYGLPDPVVVLAGRSSRSVPEKGVVKSIVDDFDGIGFILELQVLEEADSYEVERGTAATAADVNTIPPFTFLRNTGKLKFTDDDVEKGTRYFYRYRGFNNKGVGEWSEPVSRVQ